MNNSSAYLEGTIGNICGRLLYANSLAKDIAKAYFDTGSNTLIDGLATAGTAATVSTKLTKGELQAGITLAQQVQNMIGGSAVSTDDYLVNCDNLLNGSDAAGSALSNDVEIIGSKLVLLAQSLKDTFGLAKDAASVYSASEMSAILTAISDGSSVILGCNTSKTKMLNGVNVVNQFISFMTASSVSTGDYLSIIVAWLQGI